MRPLLGLLDWQRGRGTCLCRISRSEGIVTGHCIQFIYTQALIVYCAQTTDITEIAKAIAVLPKKNTARPRVIVITQGTLPTIVVTSDASAEPKVQTFLVHEVKSEDIVDTNGAGDAFAGGFLGGLVQDNPVETCVDMGQWLASLSIQELGPAYV